MKQLDSHLTDAQRRAGTTEGRTLDKRLASLLGWTEIGESGKWGKPTNSPGVQSSPLPRWTEDDGEAFRLMIANDCYPVDSYGYGTDGIEDYIDVNYAEGCDITEYIAKHISKASAVRIAIVKAVIAKLESEL